MARLRSSQDRIADAITSFAGNLWIVSLEAIFLSTFVMISQNRQAARDNLRADLDFENNVRSEVWSVHIGTKLGIDPGAVEQRVRQIVGQSRAALGDTTTPDEHDDLRP